jgi:hypothetical protein
MTLHQQILPLASSWRGRLLAPNGHAAMSGLSPLLDEQRKICARGEHFRV